MAATISQSLKEQYVFRTELTYPEDAARIEARREFQKEYEFKRDYEMRGTPSMERCRITMVPPYGPEHFPRAVTLTRGRGLNDYAGYTASWPSV